MVAVLVVVVVVTVLVAAAVPGWRVASSGVEAHGSGERWLLHDRWVRRSRRFREAGGAVGVAIGLTVEVIHAIETGGPVRLELIPLLAWGVGGSVVGSVLAETFRLRRPEGPRSASLRARVVDDYRDRVAERREWIVVGASGTALVVGVVTGAGILALATWSVVVAVLALLRRWLAWRVALRPRPDVSAALEEADDELRRLAIATALGRPIVILSMLAVSRQWVILDGHRQQPLLAAVSMALWATAVVWWWRNRRFEAVRLPSRVR